MEENNKADESRISKLSQMLEAQPDDCFLLHALGLEYLKEGNRLEGIGNSAEAIGFRQKAIGSFEKVLAVDEDYVGTYYHLALALAGVGKDSKAVFTKGIAVAQSQKDRHAESELKMAYDEIFDEEWEG